MSCMTQMEVAPGRQLLTRGERLRLARERDGYSPGQFADKLGMHRNNVPRWERPDGKPSLKVMELYASNLDNGTTVEWLAFEIGDWPVKRDGGPTDGGTPVDPSYAPRDLNPEPAGQRPDAIIIPLRAA